MDLHGGNIYKISKALGCSESEIIDFSSNINPLGVPAELKKTIIENLDNLKNYPDPDYEELISVTSNYHGVDPCSIIPGNGATELIYLYCRLKKFTRALIVAPTFVEYHLALKQVGTEVHYLELEKHNEFAFNVDSIIKKISENYDLLVLCNPNNPTGSFMKLDDIEKIMHCAHENKTSVMIDESFIQFTNNEKGDSAINLIKKYEHLFILRSMTKIYSIPGLRLGYALSNDEELNNKIKKQREPWTVNLLADLSARVLFNDKDYLKKTIELINTERIYLFENINKIEWLKVYHAQANFILVEILNDLSAADLREKLLKHRILIRDASNFKFLNENFFRIAVKDRNSNDQLLKSLKLLDW